MEAPWMFWVGYWWSLTTALICPDRSISQFDSVGFWLSSQRELWEFITFQVWNQEEGRNFIFFQDCTPLPYKLSCNCPVLHQSVFSHKSCYSYSATEKYAKWAACSILGMLSAPAWAHTNKENELQGTCMLLTICTVLLGPSGHGYLVSRPPKESRGWCYYMVSALFCLTLAKLLSGCFASAPCSLRRRLS